MKSLFETLEFDLIKERLSRYCVSSFGREVIESLQHHASVLTLKKSLDQISELKDQYDFDQPPPIEEVADLRPLVKKARIAASMMFAEDLAQIVHFLQVIRQLASYFKSRAERVPNLSVITSELIPIVPLEKAILSCIDMETMQVKSSASPALQSIRKSIDRTLAAARKKMERLLQQFASQGVLQENVISVRNDRLCLVIKDEYKRKIKGLIHDRSSTGASLFIEPMEVVDDNNRVRELYGEEKKEIEKILVGLTDKVREHLNALERNILLFGQIDAINAKVHLSRAINGTQPEIANEPIISLAGARHPLLILRMGQNHVVPLDIELGENTTTIVISGPNAGGKTVALKTVGLLTVMAMHGLHIPALPHSRIGLIHKVFANIGDEQSLENDLSTFSSHLQGLKQIADNADAFSLVLVDEIGSGTDPEEGMALAIALLEKLTSLRTLTVVTTHQSPLKAFAYETEGAENASLEFDLASLQPTYRFRNGIPGSSYAFEIAQRLGFSQELVVRARQLVGAQKDALEGLILELEEKVQSYKKLAAEANLKETEYRGLLKLYKEKYDRLRKESDHIKRVAAEEAERILRESNAAVERAIREIREAQAEKKVVQKARKQLEEQKQAVAKLQVVEQTKREEPVVALNKGDYVRWKETGATGVIISEADKKNRVMVQYDSGVKMLTPLESLEKKARKKTKGFVRFTSEREKSASTELDLRGMMSEQAVQALDDFLDEALLAGFHSVSIIHGKGSGKLRKVVGAYLSGHPQVKSYRLGYWNEGDSGVTVVELSGSEKEMERKYE